MNVTLSDAAAEQHSLRERADDGRSGTYQPDGRNINPLVAGGDVRRDDAEQRCSVRSTGLNANGSWTLFIADVSGGDVSTVKSWGLDIAAVPEPGSIVEGAMAVLFLGGVIGLYRLKGPKVSEVPC